MVYMYRGLWGLGEIPSVIILTWCHSLFTNFSMKLSLIYISFVWFTKTTNSIFVWLSIQCFLSSSGLLSIVFPSLFRWLKFNVFLIASIYWVKIMEWPSVRGRMIKIDKKRNFLSMLLEYYGNLRLKENSQWKINCNNISVGSAGCALCSLHRKSFHAQCGLSSRRASTRKACQSHCQTHNNHQKFI